VAALIAAGAVTMNVDAKTNAMLGVKKLNTKASARITGPEKRPARKLLCGWSG